MQNTTLRRCCPSKTRGGGGVSRLCGWPRRGEGVDWELFPLRQGRGGPDVALNVWVTQEQEGFRSGPVLRVLVLLCNPDTQSSVWATPSLPGRLDHVFRDSTRSASCFLRRRDFVLSQKS